MFSRIPASTNFYFSVKYFNFTKNIATETGKWGAASFNLANPYAMMVTNPYEFYRERGRYTHTHISLSR